MSKRHTNNPDSLESLFSRIEEIILANSGVDSFEECFKLMSYKIWIDKLNKSYRATTKLEIESTLRKIDNEWKNVLPNTELDINEEQFNTCLNLLNDFAFDTNDYESIDAFFEFLVNKNHKGNRGQYFTPRHIVDFCVSIIQPKPKETILDPACGSGAFLYHAYLNMEDKTNHNLWGFDFDIKAVRVSHLLMHVAGINPKIFQVNSLIKPRAQSDLIISSSSIVTIEDYLRINKTKQYFDVIITNPPFAGEITENEMLKHYCLANGKKRIERDILFIERCIELLKPNGRMSIVLPDNVFGAIENTYVREWILSKADVIGVIGLPRYTFMPHTSIKTSILFLQKRNKSSKPKPNIFFGISENCGKNSKGQIDYCENKPLNWRNVNHDFNDIKESFLQYIRNNFSGW